MSERLFNSQQSKYSEVLLAIDASTKNENDLCIICPEGCDVNKELSFIAFSRYERTHPNFVSAAGIEIFWTPNWPPL